MNRRANTHSHAGLRAAERGSSLSATGSRNRAHKPGAGRASIVYAACVLIVVAVFGVLLRPAPSAALTSDSDIRAVAEAIDRLPVVGSVLLTGAHPDDENNALLAYLARGMHIRTAYLSETRGDGGQNLLGSEQYEALGMLRTQELLAARKVDGAEQFFGQAYDFGFSKSADETLEKWGHDEALGDYVRTIRRFRPDVVISRFSGTPADGHGHHQASGILTKEAFRAAADASRFPDQISQGLQPWQAAKLLLNVFGGGGGRGGAPADAFTMTLGGFSPLYGENFGELGAQARSNHRSQGMGGAPSRGAVPTASFRLLDSVATPPSGTSGGTSGSTSGSTSGAASGAAGNPTAGMFDGVDLTLNRFTTLSGNAPGVAQRIEAIEKDVEEARAAVSPFHPDRILPALEKAVPPLLQLRDEIQKTSVSAASKDEALFLLAIKTQDFLDAVRLAGGVRIDAVADQGEVIPGGTFRVTVSADVADPSAITVGSVDLDAPLGWKIDRDDDPPNSRKAAGRVEASFRVTVSTDASPTQPYWLENSHEKDYFSMKGIPPEWIGLPRQPALLHATFQLTLATPEKPVLSDQEEVVYRYVDRIYGEREQPLTVVPEMGVWTEPDLLVFPAGSPSANAVTRTVLVRVRNNASAARQGAIHLALPAGWTSSPPPQDFALKSKDDEVSLRFEVSPPVGRISNPETAAVTAKAEVNGKSYSTGYAVIDYPHVQKWYWFRPSSAALLRVDVKVPPGLKVGYVMGSGDQVPDALKQLGVEVTELTSDDLAFGDLKRFDTIVTGIRAYEVRKDLSANQSRLMDYVKSGGTMIVQYSRTGGISDPIGPYAFNLGSSPRVDVEEAPVQILDPANPIFHFPNEITQKDFDGWVQERGTYFMEKWAPQYKPLLSSNDPGEPPQQGGMLLASYGKGFYLYTGYVWFRQLPAGVPGAYRIFANMISLGKAPTQ